MQWVVPVDPAKARNHRIPCKHYHFTPMHDMPANAPKADGTRPDVATAGAGDRTGSIFAGAEQCKVFHWKRSLVSRSYPYVLLVCDILLIAVIFFIAVAARYDVSLAHAVSRRVLLVIVVASVLGCYLIGGYNYQTRKCSFRFVSEHIIVSMGVFIGVFFVIYSFVTYGVRLNSSRSTIAATLVVFPLCSIGYRYCLSRIKRSLQRGNALCIIGAGGAARDLYRRLLERELTLEVIVIDVSGRKTGRRLDADDPDSPVVEGANQLVLNSSMRGRYVENYVVTCPLGDLPGAFVRELAVAQFSGNNICTYERYLTEKFRIVPPGELSMGWALEKGFRLNRRVTYDRVKRLSDIAAAVAGLFALSPVMLVTALAVKLTSRGPVLFKQVRVGHMEKPFLLYKFRSMGVGSEKGDKYTRKDDPRLTVIGKFIRKTRLDELPQFWNVLRGDLSLIGPRAEWSELVKGYEKKFPYYNFRHAVRPGITGWAQVNYSYGQNDRDTFEKLSYDLYYVKNYSPVLDVIVAVKTLYIVVFGRGQ